MFVLTENGTFYNFIPTISFIVEQWMPYMLHMNSYLVSSARFQFALNKRNIFEPFNNGIMGNCFFSVFTLGIYIHDFSEALVPADMAVDGAGIFIEITPIQVRDISVPPYDQKTGC